MVASAPSVVVITRPDSASGSSRPYFRFGLDWANTTIVSVGEVNVTLEMSLLSDPDLSVFHTPRPCLVSARGLKLPTGQRDCVSPACNGLGCEYLLSLPAAGSFTFQVRSRLFTTVGTSVIIPWSHVVCSSDQYAVVSGNDTVSCAPCPVGGDCSLGAALSAADVMPPGAVAANNGSVLSEVVVEDSIVAQSGYWASSLSTGLVYYKYGGLTLRPADAALTFCALFVRLLMCETPPPTHIRLST